ncbi:MAG TPA: M56 family metallopeptidase [Fimbriimonadaceae bacterium]|jgi:beta-lactamase regulating signal transducer with metallopeptidase domain
MNLVSIEIKGIIVLALAAIATLILRKSSAAKRHLIWLLAISVVGLLPLMEVGIPSKVTLKTPEIFSTGAQNSLSTPSAAPVTGSPAEAAAAFEAHLEEQKEPIHWEQIGVGLWAGGSLLLLVSLGLSLLRVVSIVKAAKPWANPELHGAKLLLTERLSVPATVGVMRPLILLPTDAPRWDTEKLAMSLSHEQAHVKRKDWLWQTSAMFLCALFPMNPLLWYAKWRLREESELACDDMVLEQGFSSTGYAEILLNVALAAQGGRKLSGAISMARTPRIEARIRSIVDPIRRRSRMKGPVLLGTLGAAAVAALFFGVLKFSPQGKQFHLPKEWLERYDFAKPVGSVVFADGNPAAESAILAIKCTARESQVFVGLYHADANGDFDLSNIQLGKDEHISELAAYVPGNAIAFQNLGNASGPIKFILSKGVTREVKLLTPEGKPLAGETAHLRLIDIPSKEDTFPQFLMLHPESQDIYQRAISNSDGVLEFRDLPENANVQWDVDDPRYAAFTYTSQIDTANPKVHPAFLQQASTIEGTVTLEGKPLQGIKVGAQGIDKYMGASGGEAVTDVNGHYLMQRVETGVYDIALDENTYPTEAWTAKAYQKVKLAKNAHLVGINFALEHGGIISGTVNYDQESLNAGVQIGIYSAAHPNSGAWVQCVQAKRDGTYEAHVPAGPAHVYIMNGGSQGDAPMHDVTVEDGKVTTVNLG